MKTKYLMKFFLATLMFALSLFAHADGVNDKISTGLAGTVGISHFGETSALTFGGPQVAVKLGDLSVAASFYPSLVRSDIFDYETRPSLGFGFEVSYRKVILFVPTYYVGDKYRTTVGLGYRF